MGKLRMSRGSSIKLWKRCLIFLLVLCMMNLSWIPDTDSMGVPGTAMQTGEMQTGEMQTGEFQIGETQIGGIQTGELQIGAIHAQAAEAYQHFYFQGGLFMIPKTSLSFPWTYMKKGDKVQFVVKSNGTLYAGLTRKSDKKMIGVKRSNNFTVSFTVPSSGYYKVFIVNHSTRAVSLKGMAVCSR